MKVKQLLGKMTMASNAEIRILDTNTNEKGLNTVYNVTRADLMLERYAGYDDMTVSSFNVIDNAMTIWVK